jgi:hypothetical protein
MTAEGRLDSRGFDQEAEGRAIDPIVADITEASMSRLGKDHPKQAEARVLTAIRTRVGPMIRETRESARQAENLALQAEILETKGYFECAVPGANACSDGRLLPAFAIANPNIVTTHQTPGGIPKTRESTTYKGEYTLDDSVTQGAVAKDVRKTKEDNDGDAESIQELGIHINSTDPLNGCGAVRRAIESIRRPESGMRFGGIEWYYEASEMAGERFFAFDTFARTLEIPSRTFDISHDIYSQGLIWGIRDAYQDFDRDRSLRENLVLMHDQGRVVMAEQLDTAFGERIHAMDARFFGEGDKINPFDYRHLAENLIRIERTARTLAREEERTDFSSFLPKGLIKDVSPVAARVLAYTLLRNIVYRTLAEIQPGNHPLIKHNERSISVRIGKAKTPIAVENIPLVVKTQGDLSQGDIDNVFFLEDKVLRHALEEIGVGAGREAAVVIVSATSDSSIYVDEGKAAGPRSEIFSTVGNNVARIINARHEADIKEGYRIVVGTLLGPDGAPIEVVR